MAKKNWRDNYDPEAAKAKVDAAKKSLEEGIRALQSGDDWKRVLDAMAVAGKFSVARFSFGNQLLIALHGGNVTRAATFQAWKRAKRHVKKGEKGMMVLRPIVCKAKDEKADGTEVERKWVVFKGMTVFALEQTEGEPLPEVEPFSFDGEEVFQNSVATLATLAMKLDGSPVSKVEVRERRKNDPGSAFGWFTRTTREIVVVTDRRSRAQQFKTLVHEIAHSLMHGIEDHHARSIMEVEAESVAYVVCKALGLDTAGYSFPYVATWAVSEKKDAVAEVKASGSRIAKASMAILEAICGKMDIEGDDETEAEAA